MSNLPETRPDSGQSRLNLLHDDSQPATISSDALSRCLTAYLMRRRQALIMELGEIEELLGLERSIMPRRKR